MKLAPNRCSVLRATGNMCGMSAAGDAPWPICRYHAQKMYEHMLKKYPPRSPTTAELELERIQSARDECRRKDAERKARYEQQSQVYYVRIGDYVKIGYTVNIQERMAGLRVDVDAVMATEPGGRKLEAERHQQFAAERQGKRENFNPSPRLLAHIEQIRADNGPPNITTYKTAPAA